jgi:hypothetical protein
MCLTVMPSAERRCGKIVLVEQAAVHIQDGIL